MERDAYLERLRRKANQAWELAGLARQDRDKADEKRWTDEARRLDQEVAEYVRSG